MYFSSGCADALCITWFCIGFETEPNFVQKNM